MSISGNFSSIPPSLNLEFARSKAMDPRVTFTRASSGTYFNSAGVLTTATTNVPRFDHNPTTRESLGLLMEEARTNSNRNNTMAGAVNGSPGTIPTYWTSDFTGLTRTVVGTGTENGISYIDLRYNGTTGATYGNLFFENSGGSGAATNGQTWTGSLFISLVGGSLTNVSSISPNIQMLSSVPAFLANKTGSSISGSITSTLTRFNNTQTLDNASVAYVTQSLLFGWNNGVAVDFTLRIGMPQLELGPFVTSVISTSSAAVTRAVDVCSMTGTNFSSWYNQSAGTFVFSGDIAATTTDGSARVFFGVGDAALAFAAAESIYFSRTASSANSNPVVLDGGSGQVAVAVDTVTVNTKFTYACAITSNDFSGTFDGGTAKTDSSLTMPTPTSLSLGGASTLWAGGTSNLTGHVRRFAYYPARLTNAQIQSLSRD